MKERNNHKKFITKINLEHHWSHVNYKDWYVSCSGWNFFWSECICTALQGYINITEQIINVLFITTEKWAIEIGRCLGQPIRTEHQSLSHHEPLSRLCYWPCETSWTSSLLLMRMALCLVWSSCSVFYIRLIGRWITLWKINCSLKESLEWSLLNPWTKAFFIMVSYLI